MSSVHIKKNIPKFIEGIQKYNFCDWIGPHLCNLDGHQGGHYFEFVWDGEQVGF